MSTPLTKTYPNWLALQDENDVKNKHYKRSIRYYKQLYKVWVDWGDADQIADIYRECKKRRKNGEDVHVDHIIPILHPHVSGLHNEFNLQIVEKRFNLCKGNRWWPDMWQEQLTLF